MTFPELIRTALDAESLRELIAVVAAAGHVVDHLDRSEVRVLAALLRQRMRQIDRGERERDRYRSAAMACPN